MSMRYWWNDTYKKTGLFGEVSLPCHFAHFAFIPRWWG